MDLRGEGDRGKMRSGSPQNREENRKMSGERAGGREGGAGRTGKLGSAGGGGRIMRRR